MHLKPVVSVHRCGGCCLGWCMILGASLLSSLASVSKSGCSNQKKPVKKPDCNQFFCNWQLQFSLSEIKKPQKLNKAEPKKTGCNWLKWLQYRPCKCAYFKPILKGNGPELHELCPKRYAAINFHLSKLGCRSCRVRAECWGSECRSVGRMDAGVKDAA